MKKLLFLLFAFGMIATANAQSTISFTNESDGNVEYNFDEIAEIIALSDTLYSEKLGDYFISLYDDAFESSPDDPSILLLIPQTNHFSVIAIQEDENEEIITLRILTRNGWISSNIRPKDLRDLATMIAFIQRFNSMSDSYRFR